MMLTLLKHEWLRTRSMLSVILGIAAMLTGLGALLMATGWVGISFLGMLLAGTSLVGLLAVAQLALALDYWRSSYGRIGYFTQTLPIRGSRIFWAKMLWGWIVTLVMLAMTLVLAAVVWPTLAPRLQLSETDPFVMALSLWRTMTAYMSPWLAVAAIVGVVALTMTSPVQYYFAASIGSESPLNRLGAGGPILTWLGLYVVVQLTSLLGLLVLPFAFTVVDGSVGLVRFDAWGSTSGGAATGVLPIGVFPPMVLVIGLCLWRTARSWDRKVSLV